VYLAYNDAEMASHVPVTLHHFKILARLGRSINWSMIHDIENGVEFFFSEDDYLKKQSNVKVKSDLTQPSVLLAPNEAPRSKSDKSPAKRRPRRMATETIRSYVVPDSDDDDDDIADDAETSWVMQIDAKKRKVETNLQQWIKELSILLKEEQRKYKEKKKRIERAVSPDTKVRTAKSEFLKSLTSNLRTLRKVDLDRRRALHGADISDFSSGDDDEYQVGGTRSNKRRRIGN